MHLLGIADVPRLVPVRVHQPVVHRALEPAFASELGYAQGAHRVRDDLGVRVVGEAVLLEHPPDAVDPRLAVAREQVGARQAVLGILGVEVEGKPRDAGTDLVLQPVGRDLADAAERSDVVGPDENGVLAHSDSSRSRSSTVSRRRITRASPFATRTAAGRGSAL